MNLGVLNRESYEKCLYRFDKNKQELYIDFLLSIPYLSHLTRAVLLKIVKSLNTIRFRKGEEVTTESFDSYTTESMLKRQARSLDVDEADQEPQEKSAEEENKKCEESPEESIYFVYAGEFEAV